MTEFTAEDIWRDVCLAHARIIEFGVKKFWYGNIEAAERLGKQMKFSIDVDMEKRTLKVYVSPLEQPSESLGLCSILVLDLEGEQAASEPPIVS